MRSEGGSSPALRTYFVGLYFTGTPVNISELSVGCWGEGALGDGLVHANNLLRTTLMFYKPLEVAVPQVQYNTRRVRLLEVIKP